MTEMRIAMGKVYGKYDIAKKRAKLDHPWLWMFYWKQECKEIDKHNAELEREWRDER
jgi:hypothetical protein